MLCGELEDTDYYKHARNRLPTVFLGTVVCFKRQDWRYCLSLILQQQHSHPLQDSQWYYYNEGQSRKSWVRKWGRVEQLVAPTKKTTRWQKFQSPCFILSSLPCLPDALPKHKEGQTLIIPTCKQRIIIFYMWEASFELPMSTDIVQLYHKGKN